MMQSWNAGKIGWRVAWWAAAGCAAVMGATAPDRPHILWITAEDLSPALGCYGDTRAVTPQLDSLAAEGVRFTRAFATSPVCSTARSALIHGLAATATGTHPMRSAFPVPDFMRGFPSYLREAGYYTTNNVKTDYNTGREAAIIAASWDENSAGAHWRNRPGGQSFFSVFNLMTTHQSRSMVWPEKQFIDAVQSQVPVEARMNPGLVAVPPYYPDTPVVRKTLARFYDCIARLDQQVGDLLQQLEEDGLADDTVVFFFGDHGTGLPRHKRALLDTGMRVPLLLRVPEKWRDWAGVQAGGTDGRLVSFVDFAPTVLRLAGLEPPAYMEGRSFLGPLEQAAPRRTVFGHRDRVDEAFDLARSVRDERFLYIRNYHPHRGYNQPTAWPDQGEIRHEFYRLADPVCMTPAQWHFAAPVRPLEELYDCQADPLNLENLAGHPDYRKTLEGMREQLAVRFRDQADFGFWPEAELWVEVWESGLSPWELAQDETFPARQARLVAAAGAIGTGDEAQGLLHLASRDPAERTWGAVALEAAERISPQARQALRERGADSAPSVRVAVAAALLKHGDLESARPLLLDGLAAEDLNVVLRAARTVEMSGVGDPALVAAMRRCDARVRAIFTGGDGLSPVTPRMDLALFVGFSTGAFLEER